MKKKQKIKKTRRITTMTKREKMHKMQELKKYKKEAIRAARELFYPPEIESKIRNANSEAEVSKIMFNQRLKMYA